MLLVKWVAAKLVSLGVFMGTVFHSSPAACVLSRKSPENEVGFLARADRQSGLMTGCTSKCPRTPNTAEEFDGCSQL